MKQIKDVYIVTEPNTECLIVMWQTYDGKFYIATHVVGQVEEIPFLEAHKLIS